MKTGRTLENLAAELSRQSKMKRDFIADSRQITINESADLFSLMPKQDMNEGLNFDMSELFHRQLGASLKIPANYYRKMQDEFPALLAENVNGWLSRSNKKHTIRTLDGKARAFLSDRYRRIDNYAIAKGTLPIIAEMPDAEVISCEITEDRMYIKVLNPRLEAEVQKGDIVQAGIVISNSEVGLGSVSVMPLVYRLVCSNGMIVNDFGKRKYHIGRIIEEACELFSDETIQADDEAFLMKLQDIVRSAVDEAKFAMIIEKLQEAASMNFEAPIIDIVELTANRYGFNTSEENDILEHLIAGGELSLYGLANAVTRASQDVPGYDRASAFEAAGWQIASMPQRTWKLINERSTK